MKQQGEARFLYYCYFFPKMMKEIIINLENQNIKGFDPPPIPTPEIIKMCEKCISN